MKKIAIVILALVVTASFCYAAESVKSQTATEPVGAVIETTGVFVGQISSVVENSLAGGKAKSYVTVSDDTGKTRMFPVDATVKIVDAGFNAITLNQLKKGEKVSVEYSGKKAKSINVQQ